MIDSDAELDAQRRAGADDQLSRHDFGQPVAHVNGWEAAGDVWKATVFLESEGGRPSVRTRFVVTLCPGSSRVLSANEGD